MDTSPDPADLQAALRELPSVDFLLKQPAVTQLMDDYPRREVLLAARAVLDQRRAELRAGRPAALDVPALALDLRQQLYERTRPQLRRVINATGIVLHTNLGRAPLAEEALDAIVATAGGYCNLELNLQDGQRGDRHSHLRGLLCELTGAQDAIVVNNNAGATYLALNTLAAGREVVISRGQLVEIGGSYRLPDIMAAARCRMVEVGTTNRTRIEDYRAAINENTALLVRVHTSNYRVEGFTESVELGELIELGRRHSIPVVDDLGSGLLTRDLAWARAGTSDSAGHDDGKAKQSGSGKASAGDRGDNGADAQMWEAGPTVWDEPAVSESVAAGADLTLFSGDKLLGGPQAGIVVGRADHVTALRRNPLARALRPGKLTLSALEATLRIYRDPAAVVRRIPSMRMLARTAGEIEGLARGLAERVARDVPGVEVSGHSDVSEAGGGSLPTRPFPTWVVVVRCPGVAAAVLAATLRRRDVPIICRMRDEALVFDPRTLEAEDIDQIVGALGEAVREATEA